MPTILELFKGSSNNITPKGLDQTPVEEKFAGSTQEKSVKSDQISKIEQEFKGVRFRSGVELNNPLLYGNQAIRIATRSTSDVEKMKQATGGTAGDGGLIGKGLGKITEGKFGKFVFGGKVTSLNQARDGINTRLGIPTNLIPTSVYNTGGLQKGLEPDTMITLSKIKNDGKGTLVGKFLKQTGGGNPKTIGNQILGHGISLVKDKLRTTLFGNPNSLGANGALASQKWEYSSNLPYSKQISNVKFNSKTVSGIEESASTNITKKIIQVQLDAKKKLGESAKNATDLLKKKLKGTESKSEIDKVLESKTKVTTATATTYTGKLEGYKTEDVTQRIDLSLVSPIKGIDRRKTKGRFGTTEYALFDPKNTTGNFSPNDPTRKYTGVAGGQKKYTLETKYGLKNGSDSLNMIKKGHNTDKLGDLIPLQIGAVNDGGKIVHFRTLITGFSETISPSWDSSKFVGNPYPFWTYSGVERSANFTLRMYCMNADELSIMWEKLNWLTAKVYPTIVDKMVQAPFITMTIGSIYKNRVGFINSLSYTINDDMTWETNMKDMYLPKVVDAQIEFKLIDTAGTETKPFYNYGLSQEAVKGINNKRGKQNDNVVGTDPITQPKSASGVGFQKIEGIQEIKIPPPPKIDSTGVDQIEPPPTERDTTPKSLDTGKPAETPQSEAKPESTTAIMKQSETDYDSKNKKAYKEYKGKGYPEWLAGVLSSNIAAGVKLDNIQKLSENAYYVEKSYPDEDFEEIHEMVHYTDGNSVRLSRYQKWVSDNNGNDPLNKFTKKEDTFKLTTSKK